MHGLRRKRVILTATEFESVDISSKGDSDAFIGDWDDEYDMREFRVSAAITARKPVVDDE